MPLITVSAGTPVVPPGTYPATLVGIRPRRMVSQFSNPPGQEEDRLEWTWLIEAKDRDVEITSISSLSTSPKSTIFAYLTALIGSDKASQVGLGLDEGDLVGLKVMAQIIEKDGFSRIAAVFPAPTVREAAPTQPKVSAPSHDDDLPF